eukprot:10180258-Lingulodinium_polyedra.AAC.1
MSRLEDGGERESVVGKQGQARFDDGRGSYQKEQDRTIVLSSGKMIIIGRICLEPLFCVRYN